MRSTMRSMKPAVVITLLLSVSGCATNPDTVRTGEQVQREQSARPGVVESTRDVTIDGARPSGVGGVIGAVIGGVGGSYIGSGRGTIVGSVVGSVLGGLAGNAAEQAASRQPGVELTVKLDDGRTVVIVQAAGQEVYKAGERVSVVSDGATARVSR